MRAPPVVALAGAFAASALAAAADPLARPSGGARVAGAALAACGLGLAAAGVATFRRRRTTVDPRYPERASTVVSDGVYRYTRNPMYLGMVAVAGGGAVAMGSPLAAVGPALLAAYLDRVQIPAEERALSELFGDAYGEYTRRVGRWVGRPR